MLCFLILENFDILFVIMVIVIFDRSMGNKNGMGLIFKKVLVKISDYYDYVIIDCLLVLGVLMVNVLVVSECILVLV